MTQVCFFYFHDNKVDNKKIFQFVKVNFSCTIESISAARQLWQNWWRILVRQQKWHIFLIVKAKPIEAKFQLKQSQCKIFIEYFILRTLKKLHIGGSGFSKNKNSQRKRSDQTGRFPLWQLLFKVRIRAFNQEKKRRKRYWH